jgi:hypothetical protein
MARTADLTCVADSDSTVSTDKCVTDHGYLASGDSCIISGPDAAAPAVELVTCIICGRSGVWVNPFEPE